MEIVTKHWQINEETNKLPQIGEKPTIVQEKQTVNHSRRCFGIFLLKAEDKCPFDHFYL